MRVEVGGAVDSPIGPYGYAVGEAGVAGVCFGPAARLRTRLARAGHEVVGGGDAAAAFGRELAGYLAGDRTAFDTPVDWSVFGTGLDAFDVVCLRALYDTVPYGAVVTYGELAARAGAPEAARAVGGAMGRNPVPIVVPCHRVVGHDGLGGFGGGLRVKELLLALEGTLPAPMF